MNAFTDKDIAMIFFIALFAFGLGFALALLLKTAFDEKEKKR